jgi:glycosyltransferase involved in cell wall biosynthesis
VIDGVQRHGGTTIPLKASVVICAYTEARWDDLVRSVESVQRQTASALEVIVAVDHNDDLLERVRAHLRDVVAVSNRDQRGLSGARNSGLAAARGELVAFLDDDAVAEPDWLARLAEGYADPRVLAVGGAVVPLWVCGRPKSFPAEFDWVVGCTYQGMPERASNVRNFIGANMSFLREVFAEIGGFRSGIGRVGNRPVGCEETELCIRALRRRPDGIILYEPRARVRHTVPANRAGWRYFASRCYSEGLSKALVARLWGSGDGLATERAYTFRTLPRGVVRGFADALRGDVSGLGRSVAIMSGLSVTTAGYLVGRARPLAANGSGGAPLAAEAARTGSSPDA